MYMSYKISTTKIVLQCFNLCVLNLIINVQTKNIVDD